MTDADTLANIAFQVFQKEYPTEFKHCVAEARAALAEQKLAELTKEEPAPQEETGT